MVWVLEPDTIQAAEADVAAARAKIDPGLLSAAKESTWVLEPETPTEKYGSPAPKPGVGEILWKNLKAAPGRMAERIGEDVSGVYETLTTRPKMTTALPLALPGGGTVVSRLGAIAAGSVLDDPLATPMENLQTAGKGIAGPAAAEILVPILGKVARSLPGMKARINEAQSQEVLDAIGRTNRVAREAIEAAPVSPMQHQPRTAAAIKRGFESGAVEEAASQRFGQTLDRVAQAAGNPTIAGPALQRAYASMPSLAQEQLVGAVGPGGFTLQQAQAIRSWLGGPAFSQSPLGQGVGKVPQQRLWGDVTQEIEGVLAGSPRALQLWQANNRAYAGTEALQEGLTAGNAFQRQPNRIFLDRSALSDYLARNEVDLRRRLGPGFDYLVERVLGGGQPGTRDILASGAGTATDALQQVYGRGQGGAPQILGSLLRTGAPNIGSQYTGRQPYSLPPELQAILDVALGKAGGVALDPARR